MNHEREDKALKRSKGVVYSRWRRCWSRQQVTNAYCVKCKASREMKSPQSVTMKNGRHAMKGTCPVCGTGMYKIGG